MVMTAQFEVLKLYTIWKGFGKKYNQELQPSDRSIKGPIYLLRWRGGSRAGVVERDIILPKKVQGAYYLLLLAENSLSASGNSPGSTL